MHVALFTRVFPPQTGGMERFAFDLATWLTRQGHKVVVVGPPAVEGNPDAGLPFEVVRNPDPAAMVRHLRAADVIHLNGLTLRGEIAALAGLRSPCITHHGYQAICASGLAWSPKGACTATAERPGLCAACPGLTAVNTGRVGAHRAGARLAATNICISNFQMERIGVPNARVILDPVGERAFAAAAPEPGDEGLIAFAGRMVAEKGLDLLLRAMLLLPEARLEVAGAGPMKEPWEQFAYSLGLLKRVRFLGALPFDGVVDLYRRASVVCVPSIWDEPFGYAAAEAMAMGRPVVATPRGALPELLGQGRGFVAQEANPSALAASIRVAMQDPAARMAAGRAAQAFAHENLHIDVVGQRYLSAYQQAT